MKNRLYLECDCHSLNHLIVFDSFDDVDDDFLYISSQFNIWKSFFQRLIIAFKYIFKMENKYSPWHETLIYKKDIPKIVDYCEKIYPYKNKQLDMLVQQNSKNVETAEKQKEDLQKKYNELIMAVCKKFEDESRHETALRYIKSCEKLIIPDIGNATQVNKKQVWDNLSTVAKSG